MKPVRITAYIVFAVCLILITSGCKKKPTQSEPVSNDGESPPPVLILPYIHDADITYMQPFGVPLDFDGEIRPHAAVDFGCPDSTEFIASVSGTLGNIWLEYAHSYQFNIVVDDKNVVHYCIEPSNIHLLSDAEKLAAVYFSPGDTIEKGEKVCMMVGGGGHLDWGLIIDNERVCPACYLSDDDYAKANTLFKALPGSYEGYENLCPDNGYHTNPR